MQISVIDLLVPTEIQVENVSDTVSKVTLEPLERGFGHTLGNALRRILLSSMPGAAVTDVVIDGISHEYSTIEGVREDVIDILLNLKDMPVKLIEGNEAELKLSVDGPCEVTSSSFEAPGNVELTDADHHVVSLVDKIKLNMSVFVSFREFYRNRENKSIIVVSKKEKLKNLLIYDAINKILIKNKILSPILLSENYNNNYTSQRNFDGSINT